MHSFIFCGSFYFQPKLLFHKYGLKLFINIINQPSVDMFGENINNQPPILFPSKKEEKWNRRLRQRMLQMRKEGTSPLIILPSSLQYVC